MSTSSRPSGPEASKHESGTPATSGGDASPAGSPVPPWQRGKASAAGDHPSGGVDAPTTQIDRPVLPPDMPNLSASPRNSARAASGSGSSAATATRERGGGARRGGSERAERRAFASVQSNRKGPRRASLQVKQIDPWSVLKLSLVLSFALFLVWMVAIGVLYLVLDGMGVWDRLNTTFTDFVSVNDPNSRSAPLIGPGRVFGVAAIVGAVNIVLMTALATISSFIYNLTSDLVGGVEVTLTERD